MHWAKLLFVSGALWLMASAVIAQEYQPYPSPRIPRQMYDEGGVVRIRQIGFFAGSEEAFAKLFREYEERNEQLKEEVEQRNP